LDEVLGNDGICARLGEAGRARVGRAFGVPGMLSGIHAAYAELALKKAA
jgi:hypothetical protein